MLLVKYNLIIHFGNTFISFHLFHNTPHCMLLHQNQLLGVAYYRSDKLQNILFIQQSRRLQTHYPH